MRKFSFRWLREVFVKPKDPKQQDEEEKRVDFGPSPPLMDYDTPKKAHKNARRMIHRPFARSMLCEEEKISKSLRL